MYRGIYFNREENTRRAPKRNLTFADEIALRNFTRIRFTLCFFGTAKRLKGRVSRGREFCWRRVNLYIFLREGTANYVWFGEA